MSAGEGDDVNYVSGLKDVDLNFNKHQDQDDDLLRVNEMPVDCLHRVIEVRLELTRVFFDLT